MFNVIYSASEWVYAHAHMSHLDTIQAIDYIATHTVTFCKCKQNVERTDFSFTTLSLILNKQHVHIR